MPTYPSSSHIVASETALAQLYSDGWLGRAQPHGKITPLFAGFHLRNKTGGSLSSVKPNASGHPDERADAPGLMIAEDARSSTGFGVMTRNVQNRAELEHLWKTLADDAKARLDRAAELLEELSENTETMPQTDAAAYNDAVRVYTEALEEFTNRSKIYQDLVLHGKIPDEGEQRRMNAGRGL